MGLEFAKEAGIRVEYVPFQGGAPALNALLGGQIPMLCISMGTLAPHARDGGLRILASFDAARSPMYPEVPTLREVGYTNLVENEWGAVYLPAKTPKNLVGKLEHALSDACAQPDLIDGMKAQFLSVNFRDSKTTTQHLQRGTERHRAMVQASKFEPME